MFIIALFAMTTLSIETASAQKKKKQEDVIVMAQFKGGQEALIDYLLQNLSRLVRLWLNLWLSVTA